MRITVIIASYISLLSFYSYSQDTVSVDKKSALTFNTNLVGDFARNIRGGIKQGATYIGLESISLEFNTEDAGWWKGGNIFIHGLNAHGNGPTQTLTGDLQVLSNIEAGDYTGLYEYWYSQTFGNLTVLFGQHDLNSEFAGTKYGGTFINSSFGIIPNISLNIPVSIYPVAAPCIMLKYTTPKFELKYAIYDGDPGNFETNRYNLTWSISSKQGFFSISELQFNNLVNNRVSGIYRLGTYCHTGSFHNYANQAKPTTGNYGVYIIADQALFSKSLHSGRGLCFFVQTGITPKNINRVYYYFGGGLRYHGILPNRFYDEIGLAFAHISLSNPYLNNNPTSLKTETTVELTYNFKFNQRYSIQPNMQYIINPGAIQGIKNCLIGIIRFAIEY